MHISRTIFIKFYYSLIAHIIFINRIKETTIIIIISHKDLLIRHLLIHCYIILYPCIIYYIISSKEQNIFYVLMKMNAQSLIMKLNYCLYIQILSSSIASVHNSISSYINHVYYKIMYLEIVIVL